MNTQDEILSSVWFYHQKESEKLKGKGWRIFNFVNVFSLFCYYLPLVKQTLSHLPKNALCRVWLKLAQWFWRRAFLKCRQYILAISLLSPLGKGRGPSIKKKKLESPYTRMICAKCG